MEEKAKINGSKSTFPCVDENFTSSFKSSYGQQGLTKREHFAGLAMMGILSQFTDLAGIGASTNHFAGMQESIARESVQMADELLKQLEDGK